MELTFNTIQTTEKWKESFEQAGVKSNFNDSNFYTIDSDSDSVYNMTISNDQNNTVNGQTPERHPRWPMQPSHEELALPNHLRPQVEVVKKLVDSYIKIIRKTFKLVIK